MQTLLSDYTISRIRLYSNGKKVALLVLLYERMIPDLHSFCLAEGRDFSIFQKAREEFWLALKVRASHLSNCLHPLLEYERPLRLVHQRIQQDVEVEVANRLVEKGYHHDEGREGGVQEA